MYRNMKIWVDADANHLDRLLTGYAKGVHAAAPCRDAFGSPSSTMTRPAASFRALRDR